MMSTNDVPVIERSVIFNQLGLNRATGVVLQGKVRKLSLQAGLYGNATPNSTKGSGHFSDGAWGELDGGHSIGSGAGYEFGRVAKLDKLAVYVDYLHSSPQQGDEVLNRYGDLLSASCLLQYKNWEGVVELMHGSDAQGKNSNVWGYYALLSYDFKPLPWRAVSRYGYAASSTAYGLRPQARYDSEAEVARSDGYHSLYFGVERFLYGNKLKLMQGVALRHAGKRRTFQLLKPLLAARPLSCSIFLNF